MQAKKRIIIANLSFAGVVICWFILAELVPDTPFRKFYTYTDALIKALIISLLIYSVERFKN